jgi:hypothetical protein
MSNMSVTTYAASTIVDRIPLEQPGETCMMKAICALGAAVLLSWGCNDEATTTPDEAEQAKQTFYEAMRSGNVETVIAAREGMEVAFAAHLDDDVLARLIGFAYVVPFVESIGTAPPDLPQIAASLASGVAFSEQAVALQSDPHLKTYNSAFYGGLLYSQAAMTNDQAAMQRARDTLDKVTREIPAFGFLTRGDVMRDAPRGSPDFATSLESYFRFYERCTGTAIDRAHPDLTPVLRRPFADPDSTCTNWDNAPYGIQGALLSFGDVLVKNGQPDAARGVYAIIPQTESYAGWPYRALADERLASDLAARAAQYETGDPRAQPRVGTSCFGCHQR